MQTLTISRTGGRSNYTLSPTRNTGELQDKFAKCNGKSRKSAIRDTRTKGNFPKFEAGMSTADYVKMFEALGTPCKPVEWEQINEEPCTLYSGADTCETLPAEFESWEDYDAAQCSAAPESTQSAANDDAAPTVPDPEPAAPGAIVAADSGMLSDRERAEFDRVAAESMAPAWSADVNGAVRRGLDRTPIQNLPNYARMAIERADADSGLRSTAKVSELVSAYAATHGAIAEEWEIASALYICGRRFWDFDAAPDGAPVAAPIETAPAEVAPPHYAIGHPLTTQSDARAPVDGERFRILERSRATYDNLWTCAEVSTARRAADVAQSIIAGWTGGERWAVCADSGAFLYGIGADGKPMSAAPVCAPADDEPAETGAAWFERIIAENKAKRDDCEARAQKVAPLDSVPFKHSDGERFGIAGPCMSEPGRFRFSYFDSRGAIGHCTRDTLALAMWEALDLGYLYATEDTAPVDPLPTQSDSVPVPGKLDATPVRPDYPDVWAAWRDVRNGRADPDAYQGHVIECMELALETGLFYNSQTWPAAAALMFERHHYPDWRDSSADNGVARFFGTDCYNAHDIIRKRAADAADKAAADGFQAGQKFARLIFNDYKLCTGAVLVSFTHTGKECRLTGKRAGRPFEFTCTATTLQNAIERAAERAERLKAKRERAKPAPVKAAPPPAELAPLAGDSDADPAEAKREAERAAALADAMARFTRGARVTAEPAQYFDGRPVAGWPNAQFLGTVRECFDNHGLASVRVKWDSGRIDLQSADRLTVIEPRTVSAERYATDTHERPCAAPGLKSYRARGAFGWIMIGATDDADAMREARRSAPDPHSLQVWNGAEYVPADDPLPGESKPDPVPGDTIPADNPRDPAPVVEPYRYARGAVVARCKSPDDFKTRAARLAEHCRMRWVRRAGGYVGTVRQSDKLLRLFAEGRDASVITGELYPLETAEPAPCEHPPARLYAGHAKNADGVTRPWVACCDCGDVLTDGAEPDDIDDDETIPAPLDGLDVAELDGLAEFERAGGEVKPIAPAYRDDVPRATATPSLRISPSDPRARIPARFAPVYLLQA